MSDPIGVGLYVLRNMISQRAHLMQRHIHELDFESYTDGLADAMGAGEYESTYGRLDAEQLAKRMDALFEADDWRAWYVVQEHLLNLMSERELEIEGQVNTIANLIIKQSPEAWRGRVVGSICPALMRRIADLLVSTEEAAGELLAEAS